MTHLPTHGNTSVGVAVHTPCVGRWNWQGYQPFGGRGILYARCCLADFRDLGTCTDQRLDFFLQLDTWTTWLARVVRLPAWLDYKKLPPFNIAISRHFPGPTVQRLCCERLLDYWIIGLLALGGQPGSRLHAVSVPAPVQSGPRILEAICLMSATPKGNYLR